MSNDIKELNFIPQIVREIFAFYRTLHCNWSTGFWLITQEPDISTKFFLDMWFLHKLEDH